MVKSGELSSGELSFLGRERICMALAWQLRLGFGVWSVKYPIRSDVFSIFLSILLSFAKKKKKKTKQWWLTPRSAWIHGA